MCMRSIREDKTLVTRQQTRKRQSQLLHFSLASARQQREQKTIKSKRKKICLLIPKETKAMLIMYAMERRLSVIVGKKFDVFAHKSVTQYFHLLTQGLLKNGPLLMLTRLFWIENFTLISGWSLVSSILSLIVCQILIPTWLCFY